MGWDGMVWYGIEWVLGSGQPVRLGRGKKASREKAGKPESKSQQQDGQ